LLAEVAGSRLELVPVETLGAALRRWPDGAFDAVLLDLSLPDSHGLETFRRMRAGAPQAPIILLTGLDDETLGMQSVQEGAQDYLVKGQVTGQLLVRAIRYAIERKRAQDELRLKNALIEDEIQMAKELQEALLPRRFPVFPPGVPAEQSALRFQQCHHWTTTLGGDFFDVLTL